MAESAEREALQFVIRPLPVDILDANGQPFPGYNCGSGDRRRGGPFQCLTSPVVAMLAYPSGGGVYLCQRHVELELAEGSAADTREPRRG